MMTRHFFILVLVFIFTAPIFVSAAPSAGLKPTSFFYFLDTIAENINLFFTFDNEKKAEKALAYAEERLAEIEAVSHENAPVAVEKAAKLYEQRISIAVSEAQTLKNKEKAEKLLTTVSERTARHQEVLAEVYNSVPDEAKAAIEKVSEASKDKQSQALQFLLERKENITEEQNEETEETTETISQATDQDSEEKRNEEENQKAKIERKGEPTATIPNKTETTKQKSNSEKQNKERTEIENLKREIKELKQKQTTQPAPVSAPSSSNAPKISSLPNGAVVELNAKGEIVRYIKQPDPQPTINTPPPEAPRPSVTPAPQITSQSNTSTIDLHITSVNVSTERNSAKIEWQTNKPTKSKILVSGSDNILKVFYSVNGLSAFHSATITNLLEGNVYSYEIEAVFESIDLVKKNGKFETLSPPPVPQPEKPILTSQPILTFDGNVISKIEFSTNVPVACGNDSFGNTLLFTQNCVIQPQNKIRDFVGDCEGPDLIRSGIYYYFASEKEYTCKISLSHERDGKFTDEKYAKTDNWAKFTITTPSW